MRTRTETVAIACIGVFISVVFVATWIILFSAFYKRRPMFIPQMTCVLGAALLVVVHGLHRAWSAEPTMESMARDLAKLEQAVPNFKKNFTGIQPYTKNDVVQYYRSTTLRDYKLLILGTNSNAMHTELMSTRKLPYQTGTFHQLLYVVAHMNDKAHAGNILEVGPGKGANSIFLASLFPEARLVGLDLTPEHVSYAQNYAREARLDNVRFVQGDSSNPPDSIFESIHEDNEDGSKLFDVIFGFETFCYLDTDEKMMGFLKFAKRALRPGGKIVVVEPFRTEDFSTKNIQAQEIMNVMENAFRIRQCIPASTWQRMAEDAGLRFSTYIDLTESATSFWMASWRVCRLLLHAIPACIIRACLSSSPSAAESGCNLIGGVTLAYAICFGTFKYGVIVLTQPK
jgi:SAM-dependent methyltransferase